MIVLKLSDGRTVAIEGELASVGVMTFGEFVTGVVGLPDYWVDAGPKAREVAIRVFNERTPL